MNLSSVGFRVQKVFDNSRKVNSLVMENAWKVHDPSGNIKSLKNYCIVVHKSSQI